MSSSNGELEIRITSHVKIQKYVTIVLDHFEKAGSVVPVVLHTLPAKDAADVKIGQKAKLPSSLTAVPRLISVVEIIKREFLKRLAEKKSARLKGLHQYNEVGILEELPKEDDAMQVEGDEVSAEEAQQRRAKEIAEALSGVNHVKQVQTPYMRVTLSMYEVPGLLAAGTTYQPPKTRKISKVAKQRQKRREMKMESSTAGAQ